MITTTKYDLTVSAFAAAQKSLGQSDFAVEQNKLASFIAAAFDPLDWDDWARLHDNTMSQFKLLKTQPSKAATLAAGSAAKVAVTPPSPRVPAAPTPPGAPAISPSPAIAAAMAPAPASVQPPAASIQK